MIVQVEQLTVVYKSGWRRKPFKAVDAVSFDVREGDFFALLGPNGAGKSTTLYCMLGLLRPTSGRVRVFGQELRYGCPAFQDVAYLPEEPHYHEYLTVEEAVTYYARLYGAPPSPQRVAAVLDRLALGAARAKRVAACSKGMKQKVGIAQCLLHQPRLLLLDEPMRGLDPLAVKEFRDVLVDLNRQGVTIVMNSHLLAEVEQLASRAAILANGRLVAIDEMAGLVHEQADRYSVEVERLETLPDFFLVEQSSHGRQRGTIPATRLYEFMDIARVGGAIVRTCSLKRGTLEDSFVTLVSPGAAPHV